MRFDVEPWAPGYRTGAEGGGAPARPSAADTDVTLERPASAWQPLLAPGDVRAPGTVLLVDGVRRVDANIWVTGDDGISHPGLAVSYAAGVVRCDLRRGAAEVVRAEIRRGLFTPSPSAAAIVAGAVRYHPYQTKSGDEGALDAAVQAQLRALEVGVSVGERTAAPADEVDLLLVDGQLHHDRRSLPRALGYAKTHSVEFLPPAQSPVVNALRAGERTPVFRIGKPWPLYSWYLRLPTTSGAPWAGIVRLECAAEVPVAEAVALADLSTVTLPRFASTPYKDPRAPQNLIPIAGLERRLRALLGDARLVLRALTIAARQPVGAP